MQQTADAYRTISQRRGACIFCFRAVGRRAIPFGSKLGTPHLRTVAAGSNFDDQPPPASIACTPQLNAGGILAGCDGHPYASFTVAYLYGGDQDDEPKSTLAGKHSASCFHAIHAWLRWRRLADGRLADAIAPAAEELARQVAATEVSAEQFWSHLIALAAEIDGNRELAETAVRKTLHMGSCPMLQLPRWSARFPTLRPLSTQPRPIFWISWDCVDPEYSTVSRSEIRVHPCPSVSIRGSYPTLYQAREQITERGPTACAPPRSNAGR